MCELLNSEGLERHEKCTVDATLLFWIVHLEKYIAYAMLSDLKE